ncbi:symporter [Salmonella enterica subsp. enterica]|uniref:Symporter n=1 Tax=Salmonella enterica I TaxID=59201 RepID=A0A379VXX1_SALET|nr:symporter [Salmonella enterica subsp. enterica]
MLVGIATLLLSLTLLPMVDWFGGGDKAKGYQLAMTVLAIIGMVCFCSALPASANAFALPFRRTMI